jgi:serine/threonine-protein phosphatase PPG1
MFDYIPVAALIDQRIFCTHGGLSPSMQTIDQIRVLPRFQEIPFEGLLTDLMWSDPETDISGFLLSKRGVGYVFGEDVVEQFSKVNDVDYILRAHQLCTDGYQELFKDRLATIWSAPNYCYRSQNKASILEIGADHSKTFKLFESSPDNSKYISEYIPSGKLLDYFY